MYLPGSETVTCNSIKLIIINQQAMNFNINKVVADNTLPVLCTPITPFLVDMKGSILWQTLQ